MKFHSLFLLLTLTLPYLVSTKDIQPEHPIVILACAPRSCSTAALRMMHARGDFICFNENCTMPYAQNHYQTRPGFYHNQIQVKTYQDVKNSLFTASQESPVFIKEMMLPVAEFLRSEKEITHNKNVYLLLLIRNPHHSIISFYNKGGGGVIRQLPEWVNLKNAYLLFKEVQNTAFHKPLIMCAEDLYTNPEQVAKALCKHLSIPFVASMTNWPKLTANFTGIKEWNELKTTAITSHWYDKAIESTQFTKPTQYAVDTQGQPTFEEVTNLEDKETCKKIYEESMKYYNLLLAEKDSLLTIQ